MSGSHESQHEHRSKNDPTEDATRFSPAGSGDRLQATRDFLAGRAGPSAQEPWSLKSWPLIKEQQISHLKEWATTQSWWLDVLQLGILERGRMEHDLFPAVEPGTRMWKVTRGIGFGRHPYCETLVSGMISDWFSARAGTPLQYLDRLCLVNTHLFHDMTRLEGFVEIDGRFAIVTSQPFFVGSNASQTQIHSFFSHRGFVRLLEGLWFRRDDDLTIFDACETNLIFSAGLAVPIDVIPLFPHGRFLEKIHEAARQTSSKT